MYQCYKNKSLKNFKDELHTNSSFHDDNTRIKDLLRKPNGRLKLFDNTVLERGIEVWNYLHESIKKAATILSFKTLSKAYTLNK